MNRTAEPATRGVVTIVLAGALLGLGFNYLGLLSRPARGLEWIAVPKELPSLEQHLRSSTETVPRETVADTTALSVAPTVAPTVPKPPAPDRPAEPPVAVESSPRSGVADPDDPLGINVSAVAGDGLPDIPDLDRPFAVELATVKKFFDAGAAYIVNARDPEEFDEGHIPGAINLPFSTAGTDPARLESINAGDRPIIIYCGGGTCEVSMSLAETLVYQFAKRKVLVYMGGYPEWESAGYPVRRGKVNEVKG